MKKIMIVSALFLIVVGCSTDRNFEKKLQKTLVDRPDILMKVIEKNPTLFIETVQKAAVLSKNKMAEKRQESEAKSLENAIDNPFIPRISEHDIIRGTKGAPIVLVEYSDFECPFCKRGFETVEALLSKYKGKIQFIFKHLPLNFHKWAKMSAEYYEALRLEDPKMAIQFHDLIFKYQNKLSNGESFLKKMAKQSGANMRLLEKNLKLDIIQKKIKEDMLEAKKFGLQGTPGFLINGVPVRGAYPVSHFDTIIEKLVSRGKLKL